MYLATNFGLKSHHQANNFPHEKLKSCTLVNAHCPLSFCKPVSRRFCRIDLCKIFRMQNIECNNHAHNTISLFCMTGNVYLHVCILYIIVLLYSYCGLNCELFWRPCIWILGIFPLLVRSTLIFLLWIICLFKYSAMRSRKLNLFSYTHFFLTVMGCPLCWQPV